MTTSYYFAGAQIIAMRETTTTITGTLMFLHTDHLGGTRPSSQPLPTPSDRR